MIGFLKGTLISIENNICLIETGGLGYEVQVSEHTAFEFTKEDVLSLWIYTHVRENSLELFGFLKKEEKKLFLFLLEVKGIGPKMALQILSSCSLDQFVTMIQKENIQALTNLPKIGQKTARLIVFSLKDKLSKNFIGPTFQDSYLNKLNSALTNLGFHPKEVEKSIEKVNLKKNLQKDLKQVLSFLKP